MHLHYKNVLAFLILAATPTVLVAPAAQAATPRARATVTTYTWLGKGLGNGDWSDGANWKGGAAPTAAAPVNLVFPSLRCTANTPNCGLSVDNITGMVVDHLTIDSTVTIYNEGSYDISGDAITVGGITGNGAGNAFIGANLLTPITLNGSQTWVFDGSFLDIIGTVSGTGDTLTVQLLNTAQPSFSGKVTVAALDVVGRDQNDVGNYSYGNGYLDLQQGSSVTGPVNVNRVFMSSFNAAGIGSLAATGSEVSMGSPSTPELDLTVNGNATFDKNSVFLMENMAPGTAGTNYPELTATGSVNLATVQLIIDADCGVALGTVYDLVSAPGGVTGTFGYDILNHKGGPIANGAIVQASQAFDGSCTGSNSAPYLQYAYGATSVTATVVAKPASTKR